MPGRSGSLKTLLRCGNAPCLEFVNTVYRIESDHREFLRTYIDLLQWARDGELIPARRLRELSSVAHSRPRQALHTLRRAIELREMLYRVFLALARDVTPSPAHLAATNGWLAAVLRHRQLTRIGGSLQWSWEENEPSLDRPLWPVVLSAAELLVSGDRRRIKECPGPGSGGCGWVFLDISKPQTRRWCSMRYCGNVDKARRHYRRYSESVHLPMPD